MESQSLGQSVSHYRIVEELGSGDMCLVFKAEARLGAIPVDEIGDRAVIRTLAAG